MKRAIIVLASLALLAAAPPAPQRPAWLQQYSWAQVQELEARIAEYAARDRVRTQTLRAAVAQAAGASARRMSFDRLIAAVAEKSKEAGALQATVGQLRADIRRLSNPAVRDPATAALTRADTALAAGRLDEAAAEFARLGSLRADQTTTGQAAWNAAIDAQIGIASLRSRYDEAATLGRRKYDLALAIAVPAIDQAWDGLRKQAYSLRRKSTESGSLDALRAAASIYRTDMTGFLTRFPNEKRDYERRLLLAETLSGIALREEDTSAYQEPNRLLREYVDYHARRGDCPDCVVAGISQLASNISTEIYRARDASRILPLVPYMEILVKVPEDRVSSWNRVSLYDAMASVFGMAGQVNRRRDTFDQAFAFIAKGRAVPGITPVQQIMLQTLTADTYRQRAEALGDPADMDRARVEYRAAIPGLTALRMTAHVGLNYKRLAHAEYVLALVRKDCAMLRESDRSLAAGLAIIGPQDFPDEYRGFQEMQRRNRGAAPQLCR